VRITDPHQRYYDFLEYGDAEGYRARLDSFRAGLREDSGESTLHIANSDSGRSSD
jgi:hypothetical protein